MMTDLDRLTELLIEHLGPGVSREAAAAAAAGLAASGVHVAPALMAPGPRPVAWPPAVLAVPAVETAPRPNVRFDANDPSQVRDAVRAYHREWGDDDPLTDVEVDRLAGFMHQALANAAEAALPVQWRRRDDR